MEAMLRRYDDMKSLFAQRLDPEAQALQHDEQHIPSQRKTESGHDSGSSPERGRLQARRGSSTTPSLASSAGDSDESTQSSTSSSQENRAAELRTGVLPHATTAAHGPQKAKTDASHIGKAGATGRVPSRATEANRPL